MMQFQFSPLLIDSEKTYMETWEDKSSGSRKVEDLLKSVVLLVKAFKI